MKIMKHEGKLNYQFYIIFIRSVSELYGRVLVLMVKTNIYCCVFVAAWLLTPNCHVFMAVTITEESNAIQAANF